MHYTVETFEVLAAPSFIKAGVFETAAHVSGISELSLSLAYFFVLEYMLVGTYCRFTREAHNFLRNDQ